MSRSSPTRPETGAADGPPPCRDGVRHTPTADLAALWQSLRRYRARRPPVLEQLGGRLLLMTGTSPPPEPHSWPTV
ncbi:hypothetical protein [Streptomyces deccanensis]|uniref:hypothetical protein n=1 Tax=Streptomyces deccanensis TaxID=424188 RepID=UPI001EFB8B3C|nr:hypothetical protein [Streptomyces deccanensis]ULR55055.1 hypothetical protein L3078_40455 [Streptomyces deccanensis]